MRPHWHIAAAALLVLFTAPALAQSWTERPYDPPVGSRWQIESQTDNEENRAAGERRDQHIHSTGELTIVEKLPDGFRIAFVNRGITLTGTAPGIDIAAKAFTAIKDIEVKARTDRSGKPVAIENLDEVKGKMRLVVDRMVAALQDNPKVAAVIKQMLDGFLIVDGAGAARTYIEGSADASVGAEHRTQAGLRNCVRMRTSQRRSAGRSNRRWSPG